MTSDAVRAKHRRVKVLMAIARFATTGPHTGQTVCELCGEPGFDAHHLIVRRGEVAKAGIELRLYVEHPINLVYLCTDCHTGKADSAEAHRDELIRIQYKRFGYERVQTWVAEFEAGSRLKVSLPELEAE